MMAYFDILDIFSVSPKKKDSWKVKFKNHISFFSL